MPRYADRKMASRRMWHRSILQIFSHAATKERLRAVPARPARDDKLKWTGPTRHVTSTSRPGHAAFQSAHSRMKCRSDHVMVSVLPATLAEILRIASVPPSFSALNPRILSSTLSIQVNSAYMN